MAFTKQRNLSGHQNKQHLKDHFRFEAFCVESKPKEPDAYLRLLDMLTRKLWAILVHTGLKQRDYRSLDNKGI